MSYVKMLPEKLREIADFDCNYPATVRDAADEIDQLRKALAEAEKIVSAAENLIKQKGRHNTEIAYKRLEDAIAGKEQP